MSLVTFSGQSPPWDLGALDANFATLNTSITTTNSNVSANTTAISALQSAATPVSFPCTVSGAFSGSVTLSYVKFGPLVWVYTPTDIVGNSNSGLILTFTQFPSAILSAANQNMAAPSSFASGPAFGVFFSCVLTSSTGVLQAFFSGTLPANTQFGFSKGLMFNYVIQ